MKNKPLSKNATLQNDISMHAIYARRMNVSTCMRF